ncbi:MAG: putative metal-binding motif-containing protein [Candidatus Woesearchaeota archaeon]
MSRANKNKKSNSKNKKYYLLGGIVLIIAIALLIVVYSPLEGINAGKATQYVGVGTVKMIGSQGAKLAYETAFAATGDNVDVTLKITTGGKPISKVGFRVQANPSLSYVTSSFSSLSTSLPIVLESTQNNVPVICTQTSVTGCPSSATVARWSVSTVGQGVTGTDVSVLKLTFKLTCPAATAGCLESARKITLYDVVLEELPAGGSPIAYGPFELLDTITVVKVCTDVDVDGYGKTGTDLRACLKPGVAAGTGTNADCNDADASINPGATEVCDGIDNDCNTRIDQTIEGMTAPMNTKLQGVCYGSQICYKDPKTLVTAWKESYLVSDRTANTNKFTNTTGGFEYQADLYSATERCDSWDNDCDGSVNENLGPSCVIGGSGTTTNIIPTQMLPPGNAFYDYTTGNAFQDPQIIESRDINMVTYLLDVRDDPDWGGKTQKPKPFTVKALRGWICDDNRYILEEAAGKFFSYTYDLPKVSVVGSVASNGELRVNSLPYSCS